MYEKVILLAQYRLALNKRRGIINRRVLGEEAAIAILHLNLTRCESAFLPELFSTFILHRFLYH
jgi:hypothetical protein